MISGISKDKLAELLTGEYKISSKQIEELSAESRQQKKLIFHLLIEKKILSEEDVIDFLSRHLKIPTLNLSACKVTNEVIKIVPKKIAERYEVFPISRINNFLTVATSNPFEVMGRDDLKGLTQCDICLVLVPPRAIHTAIENYYGESNALGEMLEGMDESSVEIIPLKSSAPAESGELNLANKEKAEDAPVVRMVDLILNEGLKLRASDIHMEPYEKNFRVRYRIDGVLKESFSHPGELYPGLVARLKIISRLDMTQKRLPQDGRFRVKIHDREIDFRISILPTNYGEKVVMRVLDRSGVRAGLEKLGFSGNTTVAFSKAIKQPYGMILVTGPTGSGKSTTLYSILNSLNLPERNLMTVEDPVEYQLSGITQTQVNLDVGLTFAAGLRSLLRQSPDIILVGEIRDSETADIAVKAALTGHLVFSTLHTNSAAGAMTRLVDMGVEPFLISSSVICVAAQRLLRRICEVCKAPVEVSHDLLKHCKMKPSEIASLKSFAGKGCTKCNKTGYYGRQAAIEILTVTPAIREMIVQQRSSTEIHRLAVEEGMQTLFENALEIFKRGHTTLAEVLRIAAPD
ncbi:MAG: Flp pilus assembly complex ATPase component TadA [Candidatus Omnitrophica bacterium]|nr:Flp pilus assembly complex ATPase component TadA [Candidatus Omnitrophota bacterium]